MPISEGFDVGLGLEGTHVAITGAAGQIGSVVVTAFLAAGCRVSALDIKSFTAEAKHERLRHYKVDITDETVLEETFKQAAATFGVIAACVAAAGLDLSFIPHHTSTCDLPLEQFQRVMDMNVTGTFLTARAWLRGIQVLADEVQRNVCFIIFGSEAGTFGVPGNADYATSKAAIQYGLTRSLAPEAVRVFAGARVNAVAPGPVETGQFQKECAGSSAVRYQESEATVAARRSVAPEAVARTCLALVSDNFSRSITGQVIPIDGGKSGRLLWQPGGLPGW